MTDYTEILGGVRSFSIGESGKETWYILNEKTHIEGNITVKGEVNIILMFDKLADEQSYYNENGEMVDNPDYQSVIEGSIIVEDENILKIWGQDINSGRLLIQESSDDAGIGSRKNHKCGLIEIHTGDVNVKSTGFWVSGGGAGIGSGHYGTKGTVNIYGGKIYALGGYRSAGIGGGANCASGKINISGGDIVAQGGDYGAGIGSGDEAFGENAGTDIYINGGKVYCKGGHEAAGLGGGNESGGGDIFITGEAYVTAIGGSYNFGSGAGIGTGDEANGQGGTVVIQDGIVIARGGERAAGIGGGTNTDGIEVRISGGEVTATGNDLLANSGGAGIGGGTLGAGGTTYIFGGSVTADGGVDAAGIGGGDGGFGGYTYITGGTVNATGSFRGAGIGSGEFSEKLNDDNVPGGTTKIYGGKVHVWGGTKGLEDTGGAGIGTGTRVPDGATSAKVEIIEKDDAAIVVEAYGGRYSAGIGGGCNANGADVYINISENSRVSAYGGIDGPGIGSGKTGGHGGTLTIENGVVEAVGGENGAGIGGGYYSDSGIITINGGHVEAVGGENGAGIGGGYAGNQKDRVTINGGYVYALGKDGGAGIGGGTENKFSVGGEGGTVSIGEDATVIATIEPITSGAYAIGNGYNDSADPKDVILHSTASVTAGVDEDSSMTQYADDRISAFKNINNHWIKVEDCRHDGCQCTKVNFNQHKKTCEFCGKTWLEGHMVHGGKCLDCNYAGCEITFKPGDGGSGEMKPVHVDPCSNVYTLPECEFTNFHSQYFMSWIYTKDGKTCYGAPGFDIEIDGDMELEAFWSSKKYYYAYVDRDIEYGKVVVGPYADMVDEGETIFIKVTPDEGFRFSSLTYTKESGGEPIPITEKDESGNYLLCMPAENITIHADFSPILIDKLTIEPSPVSLKEGESKALTLTLKPENTMDKLVVWSSDDDSVASVDNDGKVTANKAGQAIITATTIIGNKSVSCVVNVNHVHNVVYNIGMEATCNREGRMGYWSCDFPDYGCGKNFKDSKCTKEIVDLDKYVDEGGIMIRPLGHSWKVDEGTDSEGFRILKEPTETEDGWMERECTVCNTKSRWLIPATGHTHNLSLVEGEDAGCETPGKKAYFVCDHCDKLYVDPLGDVEISEDDLVIPPEGHVELSPVKEDEVPATSDKDGGYNLVTRCKKCGVILKTEWIVIPATGEDDVPGDDDKPIDDDKPGEDDKPSENDKMHADDKPGEANKPGTADKTVTSWIQSGGKWYYICSDGAKACLEYREGCWLTADGSWDPVYNNGHWVQNEKGWWYEDTGGWYPVSMWLKIDGYWYYFDESGYMAASEWRDGYWLSENGALEYEGIAEWKSIGSSWWYEDSLGWYPVSKWQKIDGCWYYFEASGYMV